MLVGHASGEKWFRSRVVETNLRTGHPGNIDGECVLASGDSNAAGVRTAESHRAVGILATAAEGGGVVLVIDSKNERVAGWYARLGAVPILDSPLSLLLPLATIEAALKKAGKY